MRRTRKKRGPGYRRAKREMRDIHVAFQKNRCAYCLKHMNKRLDHPDQATLEHFVPSCYHGRHNLANTIAACGKCNCDRNESIPTMRMMINLVRVRKWKTLSLFAEVCHWYASSKIIQLICEVNYAISKIKKA